MTIFWLRVDKALASCRKRSAGKLRFHCLPTASNWGASRQSCPAGSRDRWRGPTFKMDLVLSDIMGDSGRRIIEAMIAGLRDPRRLAAWQAAG